MPGYSGDYSASRFRAITPSDTALLEPRCDGIYVGTAGDVVAEGADGVVVTFKAVSGATLPISPVRIWATGTTALALIGLRP